MPPNLSPLDPVTLGLCSQIDLDMQVSKAAKEKPAPSEHDRVTLLPASVTTAPGSDADATKTAAPRRPAPSRRKTPTSASVFAKLKKIGGTKTEEEQAQRRSHPRESGDPAFCICRRSLGGVEPRALNRPRACPSPPSPPRSRLRPLPSLRKLRGRFAARQEADLVEFLRNAPHPASAAFTAA